MRFCVKCGKTISTGVFCRKCKAPKVKLQEVSLKVCACHRVFDRGQWLPKDLNILISSLIQKQIKVPLQVDSRIQWVGLTRGKNKLKVKAQYKEDAHSVPVTVRVEQCPTCQRMKSGYFEGTLQVRNANAAVEAFVEHEIEANRDRGVFIAKKVPFRDGVDYYISDQHFIQNLGNKLYEFFGGVKKVNVRLHGHDSANNKDLYRVTVLVELPAFKSGDVVKVGKNLVWVQEVKRNITGVDLKLHKKLKISYKDSRVEVLPKYRTHITRLYPYIEVLNPLDYQSIMVKNKLRSPHTNQEVEIVIDKGVYVVE